MKISTKGRYAIRFMVDLSEHCSDSPVKILRSVRLCPKNILNR